MTCYISHFFLSLSLCLQLWVVHRPPATLPCINMERGKQLICGEKWVSSGLLFASMISSGSVPHRLVCIGGLSVLSSPVQENLSADRIAGYSPFGLPHGQSWKLPGWRHTWAPVWGRCSGLSTLVDRLQANRWGKGPQLVCTATAGCTRFVQNHGPRLHEPAGRLGVIKCRSHACPRKRKNLGRPHPGASPTAHHTYPFVGTSLWVLASELGWRAGNGFLRTD